MTNYNVTVTIVFSDMASSFMHDESAPKVQFTLNEKPTWRSQYECFSSLKQYAPQIRPHSKYTVTSGQIKQSDAAPLNGESWLLMLRELQAIESGALSFNFYKGRTTALERSQQPVCAKMDIQLLSLHDLKDSIDGLAEEIRQSNRMTQQLLKALGENKDGVLI